MRTISWKITDGRQATVAISVDKRCRTVNNGWGKEIPTQDPPAAWTIRYSAKVEGAGEVNELNLPPKSDCPEGFAGRLDHLCYDSDIREQIEASIAEVESSADWQKHLKAEAEVAKSEKEYWAGRRRIERAMNM